MTKLEEFKTFVTTIPSVKEEVLNGRYTWQQLYEIYVMYGKDDKFWQPYRNTGGMDLSSLLEIIKNVDMNALSNSLNAIEKVLNMASGLFGKEEEKPAPRQKNKWYDE